MAVAGLCSSLWWPLGLKGEDGTQGYSSKGRATGDNGAGQERCGEGYPSKEPPTWNFCRIPSGLVHFPLQTL